MKNYKSFGKTNIIDIFVNTLDLSSNRKCKFEEICIETGSKQCVFGKKAKA